MLITLKDHGANDFKFHWSSFLENNPDRFCNRDKVYPQSTLKDCIL
jgi:hypothetical protein